MHTTAFRNVYFLVIFMIYLSHYCMCRFLEVQFYACFQDSPEVPYLLYLGVLTNHKEIASGQSSRGEYMSSTINAMIRRRLEMYLGVFAAVKGPRQLVSNELLFALYSVLLTRPEQSIAKLALDCVIAYKQPYVTPYEATFIKLMDEKSLREELIVFDASEGGAIEASHRAAAIPLMGNLLFGRLLSKVTGNKSKDQKSSRFDRLIE